MATMMMLDDDHHRVDRFLLRHDLLTSFDIETYHYYNTTRNNKCAENPYGRQNVGEKERKNKTAKD
jgi:hypothetical protein